jgi:hypothetical protein
VRILTGSESPRQLVRWRMDLNQVVAGLNLTTVATIKPVHLACMRTGPKAIYDASCDASAEDSYEQLQVQESRQLKMQCGLMVSITTLK